MGFYIFMKNYYKKLDTICSRIFDYIVTDGKGLYKNIHLMSEKLK
jgi:hypothetical protein